MNPVIEVDLDAIRANYRSFEAAVGVGVMPIVKAEGYGHGALAIAQAVVAAGAPTLGVADAREAIALRDAGIDVPILSWLHSPVQDWEAAFAAELELGVSSFDLLAIIGERAAHRPGDSRIRVHLKLDTGLGRNGAREIDWVGLFAQARDLERAGLIHVVGMFSHLAGAGEQADLEQIAAFERGIALAKRLELRPDYVHLAATGAALRYPQARYDFVRLGIGLYGLSPFSPDEEPGIALKPALSLQAPIKRADDGWCIEMGTAHGLTPVAAALPPFVDNHGDRWRLLRLEANHSILEPLDELTNGVPRTAFVIDREPGRSATADDWAKAGGTINYEITTRLSQRIQRAYVAPEPLQAAEVRAAGGERRVSPRRQAIIDLDTLRVRLQQQDVPVDLSADAYGHGMAEVLGLVLEAGLQPIARTQLDLEVLRAHGATNAALVPEAPAETRMPYGFDASVFGGATLGLRSELVHVKRVQEGQAVSYGYEWRASHSTTLGLVPIGYADAIPRSALGHAYVSVGGVAVPVVGRVAMDQVVIDLGDIESWPGMPVHIWGSETGDISLGDWAHWTGLTPEALCASLGPRVERIYLSREPFEAAQFGGSSVQGGFGN
ncbi:MAG: alanine racemase [Gulosibacter sp.]|uniref:alanine racemase n=1 Tax=Gulosibacter sp. TaxID=2817531 RepID=UPI003F92BDF6